MSEALLQLYGGQSTVLKDRFFARDCAAALIQINRLTGWQPHELSANATQPVPDNLKKVRAQLADER